MGTLRCHSCKSDNAPSKDHLIHTTDALQWRACEGSEDENLAAPGIARAGRATRHVASPGSSDRDDVERARKADSVQPGAIGPDGSEPGQPEPDLTVGSPGPPGFRMSLISGNYSRAEV